jgi:hypothetical protein
MVGYWMLDTRCSILDTGCSILDARYWILDTRYSMLDTRYWMLDARLYWSKELGIGPQNKKAGLKKLEITNYGLRK